MRLASRKRPATWVGEGMVVDGYVVERVVGNHQGAEVRHVLRGPDGQRATLITSRGPYVDRRARSRFRRLLRLRMELDHAALIPVHAFGEYEDQPYLITDLYPSRTLGDMLARQAPLDVERIIGMLAPVADALDLAHACGLIHQTLDSDSLLLPGGDRVLLDSFGLLAAEGENLVQLGDLRYRPPEQVRGEPLTALANVYSLTALIVHALTGEPPYGGDRMALPYAQLAEAPPNVTERAPWLLPEIDAVVQWGLSKEPTDRPGSATAALQAVALAAAPRVNSSRSLPTALRVAPAPRARQRPARRRPARSALAAAIAVAAVCGALAAAVLDPFGNEAARPAPTEDSRVWRQLVDQHAALRDAIAAARTPSEQAAAMIELASAYTAAGRADGPARLVAAARSAGAAYADLARATEAADESAFTNASAEVVAAERRLAAAAAR